MGGGGDQRGSSGGYIFRPVNNLRSLGHSEGILDIVLELVASFFFSRRIARRCNR